MADDKVEISLSKKDKISYAIYMKLKVFALNNINLDNTLVIISKIMKELNHHNVQGESKKQLCIQITILLINDFGEPWMQETFNEEMIGNIIENIYRSNLHRGKGKSNCVIF